MAKHKKKHTTKDAPDAPLASSATVITLKQNSSLWYRIKILLYDLRHLDSNPASCDRLNQITDPHYISSPYFTEAESTLIKTALISQETTAESSQDTTIGDDLDDGDAIPLNNFRTDQPRTFQAVVEESLASFLEKRKASGDARPCEAHTIAPLYESIFGISRQETLEENFLRRVRKTGIGEPPSSQDDVVKTKTSKK